MPDYERLTPNISDSESECEEPPQVPKRKSKRSKKKRKVNDRDDLGGMIINMTSKIDIRELFIIWVAFLFINTQSFICFLKKIKGTVNDTNSTMTMKGTFYASLFMILVVIICTMLF